LIAKWRGRRHTTGTPDNVRILFLCQYFPPEMGAPAARTFEHAREWARAGHQVTVVCGKPNHPDGIIPPKYRGPLLYREDIEGIRVLRCWLYATPNRGVIKRSVAFMTFMFSSMFFGAFFSGRCDVVVATSPQLLCAIAGWAVSVLKWKPFVFEVRDLWPKQIIDLGAVRNRFIIALLKSAEMFLYRRARRIVVVAPATREEIAARGIPAGNIHTITNGINDRFFQPKDRMVALRDTYGWGGDIIVMYIGTHGLSQGLSTVIEAAELLRDRKDIRFVFAGQGAEREMLMRIARERGLANVQFLPMQSKERMPDFYAAADICLVPLKKRDYFLYNIPSKMFEIMACARPIVLGVQGQALEVLNAAGAGVAVEPENARAYADAIRELAGDPGRRAELGRNGRAHAVEFYSRRQKAADYLVLLREVVDGG
jgi:glycosyltransferase involved in cell wall biosynthesis